LQQRLLHRGTHPRAAVLAASTAAKVAAVAAHFPTVCEDYIQALLDLAFVRPIDFRVQIAMEEGFISCHPVNP